VDFNEVDDGTVCDCGRGHCPSRHQDESECDRDKGEAAAKANERDQDAEGDRKLQPTRPVDEMR